MIHDRIEVNPNILCGKPVIKGTRIPVYLILELLGAGDSSERILQEYPSLTADDIRATIMFASYLANFEEVPLITAAG